MAENLITKITVKNVCGNPDLEQIIKAPGQQIDLMDVFGLARKALPGESQYGPYVKFSGSFKAINLQTGETVRSGACILPGTAQEMLAGEFTDDTTEIKFGFKIGVKYDKASKGTNYSFVVTPLTEAGENDPLVMLEAQIKQERQRQLAAPGAAKAGFKAKGEAVPA